MIAPAEGSCSAVSAVFVIPSPTLLGLLEGVVLVHVRVDAYPLGRRRPRSDRPARPAPRRPQRAPRGRARRGRGSRSVISSLPRSAPRSTVRPNAPRRRDNAPPCRTRSAAVAGYSCEEGTARSTAHSTHARSATDAHRHSRGLRRDDRPRQGGRVRLPGDQRHLLADPERGPARASPTRAATASCRSSTGGAEYLSGPTVKDMVTGAVALAPTRTRWPRSTRSTSPCTPTTARRTSWTASSGPCWPSRQRSGRAGRGAAVPVPHVGRLGCAARTRTCDRRGAAGRRAAGQDRFSRSRSAWWAARRTASSARSTRSSTPRRGRPGHRGRARPR